VGGADEVGRLRPARQAADMYRFSGTRRDSNQHRHEPGGEAIDLRTRATYPEGSFVTVEPHPGLAPVLS